MEYTIADVLDKAKAEPSKEESLSKLLPVLTVLREEKKWTWGQIQNWMLTNTGHQMQQGQWAQKFAQWKQQARLQSDMEEFDRRNAEAAAKALPPADGDPSQT
jgi:hypothetical protein